MTYANVPEELVQRLCAMSSLAPTTANHLVQEILHFYRDTAEDFIIKRHSELQNEGLSNSKIYAQIELELHQRRFHPPPLSLRQIRRIIYG